MSISTTNYVYTPPGGVPHLCYPNDTGSDLVRVTIASDDNEAGIAFLRWFEDKIRADQDAAKAFAFVDTGRLTADDLVGLGKPGRVERMPAHPGSSAAPRPELPTTISGRPVINEGDAAPSADVVSIAAESQFRIP